MRHLHQLTEMSAQRENQEIITGYQAGNVYQMDQHSQNMKAEPAPQSNNVPQIDFGQAEQIELSGGNDTDGLTNLQYFSSREEFEDRLNALMSWAGKMPLSTVYGIITLKHSPTADDKSKSKKIAILDFEEYFVRNIRVPRKYTPPSAQGNVKRKSDKADYKNIRGNFDLVCRSLVSRNSDHMLEFVLYDCSYSDAHKKMNRMKSTAKEMGLGMTVEMSHYTGQKLTR